MTIDWFTWAAQIVNFLILVVLLKKFLYRPVLNAIEAREQAIAAQFDEAQRRQAEADRSVEEHRVRLQELDTRREEMLQEARQQVDRWRQEALRQAKDEIDQQRAEWHRALERERGRFLRELRERTGRRIAATVRQTLQSLANQDLESHLAGVFLDRLDSLDRETQGKLAAALKHSANGMVVRSAFEMPDLLRQTLRERLQRQFGEEVGVAFETFPDLICGIELAAADYRLPWSVSDYLDSLEQSFATALEHEGHLHEAARQADR